MNSKVLYLLAADAILLLHALFVAFAVLGLLLIFVGKFLSWSWVRSPWFRWAHLVGIGVVVIQSWLGVICPLTIWEAALRSKAGAAAYAGSFIAHWLEAILYYRAPERVFVAAYTAFGLLVGISWFWVRPRPFVKEKHRIAARGNVSTKSPLRKIQTGRNIRFHARLEILQLRSRRRREDCYSIDVQL